MFLASAKEFDSEANELLLSIKDEARQWHEDNTIGILIPVSW